MDNGYNNADELQKIEINLLLEGIHRYYGFDFRSYSYSSMQRRIRHRMLAEKLRSISQLQEKVLHDRSCLDRLQADFSISVTDMFRNPEMFKTFRDKVIPLLRTYPFIRIWHAGCSSGEEVFSMAILLHEEGLYDKTRIYATDMNLNILEQAKEGVFPIKKMRGFTRNYMESGGMQSFSEYYTAKYDSVIFHPFLKKNMIFAQHNLVTDQSFNEFHVIFCRNVMIYFNKQLQDRVHRLFYESLGMFGILALGNKESISFSVYGGNYEEISHKDKLYRKIK